MSHALRLACATGFMVATSAATAQNVASALIHEGDDLGEQGIVTSINNSAINPNGGYAFTVNSDTGAAALSNVWGHLGGGVGSVLRTEGTFKGLVQTSYESFFGIGNDTIVYSASGTDGPVGGFDSVWMDDIPLAVEGNAAPEIPGQFWRFASRPGVTADGTPYWVGGITDTAGGATQNRGLFMGATGTPVLLGGDLVPGLPIALSTAASVSFDYRFSSLGTNYLTEVQMDTGTGDDAAMVLSGSALTIGGGLVREGSPVPVSAGGIGGENWDNFDFVGINEAGDYMFTGDTDGATTSDEIIVINDQIMYREGDTVDGFTLTGSIEGAYMNEQADVAYIWDVVENASSVEALFFNDMMLLKEGDAIDWDGDGTIDPGATVDSFTGISSLTLGDRDGSGIASLYFTADILVDGNVLEGGFVLSVPGPSALAFLALAGIGRRRRR